MKVGIARTSLNPSSPVTLDGFGGRDRPSTGLGHDIDGVCAVFESGARRLAIMGLDVLAVDDYLLVPLRQAAKRLGIPAKNLMVNTSHTHCAPNVTPCRSFMRRHEDAYLEDVKTRLCNLLAAAVADLQEARLDYTVGACTMGMNRRRQGSSGLLPNPDKPIDLDVPVLRVLSPAGQVRGVLFSYACHPSAMGGYDINSDFPGYARDEVARAIPGCQPLFLQGCGGDIKPRNLDPVKRTFAGGPVEVIAELGHELGRAVGAALCGEAVPLGDGLAADSEYFQVPFGPHPTAEEVDAVDRAGGFYQAWAQAVKAVWASGHKLPYQLPIEVQVFDLGGLLVVGMAAEVCVEVGLHIKAMFPDRRVMALGYTNGGWDYFAPQSAHTEDGYTEGYEVKRSHMDTVWPWVKPLGFSVDSETLLLECVRDLVAGLRGPRSAVLS